MAYSSAGPDAAAMDDCGECVPDYTKGDSGSHAFSSVALAYLPFLLTFLIVAALVWHRLFPLLSGDGLYRTIEKQQQQQQQQPQPQTTAGTAPILSSTSYNNDTSSSSPSSPIRRASALAFSAAIALSAVLAELVLCEISGTVDPVARGVALQVTLSLLLVLVIVIIPSLEIYSVVSGAGYKYALKQSSGVGGTREDSTSPGWSGRFWKRGKWRRLRMAWILHTVLFGAWLYGFWWSGHAKLARYRGGGGGGGGGADRSLVNAATEHVGVLGISLMALLSGFASVSAPWQDFGARASPVSETSVARQQAGLESAHEMLNIKRSRLRALERKMVDANGLNAGLAGKATMTTTTMLQRTLGAFRSSGDAAERQALQMEINGLENMALTLSTHLSMLTGQLAAQQRARTAHGRLLRLASRAFSVYCLYRIAATAWTALRRARLAASGMAAAAGFIGSDPINNILALLTRHYDSQLDRAAWARQLGFVLSGVMLAASFNSVLQTFSLFARFAPGLLRAARRNLALVVAQTCAVYVISVALLLRGVTLRDVVKADGLRGLGGADLGWVDGWFEAWFLGGVALTACGIWVVGKIRGIGEWDDEEGEDVEMGKLS